MATMNENPSKVKNDDTEGKARDRFLDALRGNLRIEISVPKREIKVFVSSTFTDTHDERNIILNEILPFLRELARQHNVVITIFDMRSGITDGSSLDHSTWDNCKYELQRCFRESAGLVFLSLQADKYGYMPLPKTIDKDVFEAWLQERTAPKAMEPAEASSVSSPRSQNNFAARVRALVGDGQGIDEEVMSLFQLAIDWYTLDENAVPPVYTLRNLNGDKSEKDMFWNDVQPKLKTLFDGIVFDRSFEHGIVGRSVTEYV
jgi:Domain of unknown function (DUF4062)